MYTHIYLYIYIVCIYLSTVNWAAPMHQPYGPNRRLSHVGVGAIDPET